MILAGTGGSAVWNWGLVLAAAALTGCGTIVRGAHEDVPVQVDPPDAKVTTTLGDDCVGPCVIKAPRNRSFTVTATAPGYKTQVVPVGIKATGAGAAGMAGNLIIGGVVGIGVDAVTGAINDHYPNPVVIKLEPEMVEGGAPAKTGTPSIVPKKPLVETSAESPAT